MKRILEIRPNNAGGQTIVVRYEPKPNSNFNPERNY